MTKRDDKAAGLSRYAKRREADLSAVSASSLDLLRAVQGETALQAREKEIVVDSPLLDVFQIIGRALHTEIRSRSDPVNGKRAEQTIAAIAYASELDYRAVNITDHWYHQEGDHMIGHLRDGDRPVALLWNARAKSYEVRDHHNKLLFFVDAENRRMLRSSAFVFYRRLPRTPQSPYQLVMHALITAPKDIWALLAFGFIGVVLSGAIPLLTGLVVDVIIPSSQAYHLVLTLFALAVVALSQQVIQFTRDLTWLRIPTRAGQAFDAAIFSRLLYLPAGFFRALNSGDLAFRLMSAREYRNEFAGPTGSATLSVFFASFNLIWMFAVSWKAAIAGAAFLGLVVLINLALLLKSFQHEKAALEYGSAKQGFLLQILSNIEKIRVSGSEQRFLSLFLRRYSAQVRERILIARYKDWSNAISSALPYAVIGLTFGFFAAFAPEVSDGLLLAFLAAFAQLAGAATTLTEVAAALLKAQSSFRRLAPILTEQPEYHHEGIDPGPLKGGLSIKHLSFRYSLDQPMILEDVTFSVEPGEFVAIVGESGCGKSTLLRLLLGFEVPDHGLIYYDNHNLADQNLQDVRRQLGVVLQDSEIFPGSIIENISGQNDVSLDQAIDAAKAVSLYQDIARLPMGMSTVLTQGGKTLSGGQKQRLLIARALVNTPKILFFDEATSALDNPTQRAVQEQLSSLKVTRLVIAHRLSTIVEADKILVMAGGKIAQSGTYVELSTVDGPFKHMVERQSF